MIVTSGGESDFRREAAYGQIKACPKISYPLKQHVISTIEVMLIRKEATDYIPRVGIKQ